MTFCNSCCYISHIGRRVIQHPKLLLTDPGLPAPLQELDVDRALRDGRLGGALLENFILEEIAKQIGWSRLRPSLYYLRTYDGAEIDAELERRNGDVVGIAPAARRVDVLMHR